MSQFRLARLSLLLAAIGLNLAPALLGASLAQAADKPAAEAPKADTVRMEMFKLIDPATVKGFMDAKNYAEVLNRINQADALPDKTAYESFVLNRLRIALASVTGDSAMAIKALEAVIASDKLPAADRGDFIQALANYHYNAKD